MAGILAWRAFSVRVPPGARAIQSIAVLPFVNLSGDPAQEYFVDGMTDGLINALCRISAVSVKARTSVMAFKGSKKSFGEIARELKVDAIVEGSAVLTSNGAEVVRIAVNVIDAATQTQLWSTALERSLQAVLTIHVDLARAIAANIRVARRCAPVAWRRRLSRRPRCRSRGLPRDHRTRRKLADAADTRDRRTAAGTRTLTGAGRLTPDARDDIARLYGAR